MDFFDWVRRLLRQDGGQNSSSMPHDALDNYSSNPVSTSNTFTGNSMMPVSTSQPLDPTGMSVVTDETKLENATNSAQNDQTANKIADSTSVQDVATGSDSNAVDAAVNDSTVAFAADDSTDYSDDFTDDSSDDSFDDSSDDSADDSGDDSGDDTGDDSVDDSEDSPDDTTDDGSTDDSSDQPADSSTSDSSSGLTGGDASVGPAPQVAAAEDTQIDPATLANDQQAEQAASGDLAQANNYEQQAQTDAAQAAQATDNDTAQAAADAAQDAADQAQTAADEAQAAADNAPDDAAAQAAADQAQAAADTAQTDADNAQASADNAPISDDSQQEGAVAPDTSAGATSGAVFTNNVTGNPRQGQQYTVRDGKHKGATGEWHDYADGTHIFVKEHTPIPVAVSGSPQVDGAPAPADAAPVAVGGAPQSSSAPDPDAGYPHINEDDGNPRKGQHYKVITSGGFYYHVYEDGARIKRGHDVNNGAYADASYGSVSMGDAMNAGLGMFPHASNYHESVSVSKRSSGAVVGGFDPNPETNKPQGWGGAIETPHDPAGSVMAVDSNWDTDPLSLKGDHHPKA
jgi:hypothetical protein